MSSTVSLTHPFPSCLRPRLLGAVLLAGLFGCGETPGTLSGGGAADPQAADPQAADQEVVDQGTAAPPPAPGPAADGSPLLLAPDAGGLPVAPDGGAAQDVAPYSAPDAPSVADTHSDWEPLGYLDVTRRGADPSGAKDSTAAINKAIAEASSKSLALFFPAGTYLVSDTIQGLYQSKDRAARLVGSTRDPSARSVIRLAASSPGFQQPASPKVVVHLRRLDEKNADHYESSIQSIDIVVGAGNPGAVGLRNQGAENTHINDVHIDLSASGYCGIWGLPGSGGSTHKVSVKGGKIGINTYDARVLQGVSHSQKLRSQPTVVVTGLVLEGQSDVAIQSNPRGPLVVVGARIGTAKKGPIFRLRYAGQGECLSSTLALVDTRIEYAAYSPDNVLAQMDGTGRSLLLENTFVKNGAQVVSGTAKLQGAGWTHLQRLAYRHPGAAYKFDEAPYVDGAKQPQGLIDRRGTLPAPPVGLVEQHQWRDDFPSFETAGSVSVKDLGAKGDGSSDDTAAIQAAINQHEVVFFPKGDYRITNTVQLKANSKLVGVANRLSRILAHATVSAPFGNNPDPDKHAVPMLSMPDVAGGSVVLSNIHVAPSSSRGPHIPLTVGHYAIRWRCNALLRAIDVDPYKPFFYHPGKAMDTYYKDTATADNGKYPRLLKHDVLPMQWPLIWASGHAAGRVYNFFQHGDDYQEPEGRQVLLDGTTRPISFYHFHCQQQVADYFLEARQASQVSVYGSKSEHTFGIARFVGCNNVRYIGHSGIGSAAPDNPAGIDWFFSFKDSDNFVFGAFSADLGWGGGNWICHHNGYACWWKGAFAQDHVLVETRAGGTQKVPKLDAPIAYLRGTPQLAQLVP